MEDDILDFEETTEKSIYATRSVKLLMYVFGIYGLLIFTTIFFPNAGHRFIYAILTSYIIAFLLSVAGLMNGIISIFKKEKSIWLKCGGTIGNTIMVVIMGLILFANAMDFYRFFSE